MHKSHKAWIMLAVFIVVLAFLAATFFALSPKKMAAFAKQQQAMKKQQQQAQQQEIEPAETEENKLPDELETIDMEKEIENDRLMQEEA